MRRAAGQEQSLRSRAALLAAIKLQRLVDLDVQLGHELARDFGNRRLVRIVRLLVGAAEADETFGNFDFLRLVKFQLRLVRKILRDGVRAQIDAARKNFSLFKEQQVARLRADVEQHRAVFQVAVIIAERVAQRRRRGVAKLQIQLGLGRHAEQALDNVRFDGHQQHFQFAARRRAEDLIIPHDFGQRERHVLLRLVLDDLIHLAGVHRRQLDELGKNMEARRADVHALGLEPFFGNRRLQAC